MPLLKLWNSLWGRGSAANETGSDAVPSSRVTEVAAAIPSASSAPPSRSKVSRAKQPRARAATSGAKSEPEPAVNLRVAPATTLPPAPKPKVVTRGEHAELCRLVIESGACSVLEIGVGDGSRAAAVMQSLQAVSGEKPLKYAAIDGFEMVGGSLTLKDFHHKLRAAGVRPQVFPSAVAQGLFQFSRTVGFADLVISTAADEVWEAAETRALIVRITRPSSVVLHQSGGRWRRLGATEFRQPSLRSAA